MTTIEEGTHTVEDGTELYTKTWKIPSPKARLLFVHGFSDHCNNYDDLFTYLTDYGIEVYAFDQRGWGRSVHKRSQRGLTGPTTTVMADITSMLQTLLPASTSTAPSSTPLYLMGHSMGGAEVLTYASLGPPSVLSSLRGIIASAPLIALHPSSRPWRATVLAGRLAGRLLPHRQLVNQLDASLLSRDPEANARWKADPLAHDTGTLEGLAGMLDRGEGLESGKVVVREGVNEGGVTRLLVLHGTKDRVNLYDASRDYVERTKGHVQDVTLVSYDGWYHNLHAELGEDKIKFARDVAAWILERADEGAAMAKL